MNAWDAWIERERAKLGDRALEAVQLLTRIRLENPVLWQAILEFAGKGEAHERQAVERQGDEIRSRS